MGIVIKNSAWNLFITFVGFGFGALNVIVLYVYVLGDEYYGLTNYILSTAYLIFPWVGFGLHNAVVKFYTSYKTKKLRDAFLSKTLASILLLIIPFCFAIWLFQEDIEAFISARNILLGDYLWHIVAVAIFHALFEFFYAWVKVHLKTIGGNFLKEVSYRIAVTICLLILLQGYILKSTFIDLLVLIYGLRALAMAVIAIKTYLPQWNFKTTLPHHGVRYYALLMLLAGAVATSLIDLDKTMLGHYVNLELISYYGVAAFIAAVVAVPARAMSQITFPLISEYYNNEDYKSIEGLYKNSSLNLIIVGGFLLCIILCNLNQFYFFLKEPYRVALPVAALLSAIKFLDNVLGSNNAILFNTNLYKVTLWLGVAVVIVALILNAVLIPIYGIYGAAIATGVAYVGYDLAKGLYVYLKLGMHPWTGKTFLSLFVILLVTAIFYFWDFSVNPIVNIALKSILLTLTYLFLILKFKLSKNINALARQYTGWKF